jgi:hypothetical protein
MKTAIEIIQEDGGAIKFVGKDTWIGILREEKSVEELWREGSCIFSNTIWALVSRGILDDKNNPIFSLVPPKYHTHSDGSFRSEPELKPEIGVIEKDVPMPPDGRCNKKVFRAITKLNVSESVLYPLNLRHPLSSFVHTHGEAHNKKFVTRKTEDGEFVRVWRKL